MQNCHVQFRILYIVTCVFLQQLSCGYRHVNVLILYRMHYFYTNLTQKRYSETEATASSGNSVDA